MTHQIIEELSLALLLLAALLVHLTPVILAHHDQHPQRKLIAVVNLVPGLGWFIGLALLTSSHLALRRVMGPASANV